MIELKKGYRLFVHGNHVFTASGCHGEPTLEEAISQYSEECERDGLIDKTQYDELDFQIESEIDRYCSDFKISDWSRLNKGDFQNIADNLPCGFKRVEKYLKSFFY